MNKYLIITYGCQMNVHDSERLAGMLKNLNYEETDDKSKADIIVFNTCCIRETAEDRVFGNVGALKKLKKQNKDLIIAVCGCMMQQVGAAESFKEKYPFVDIIFGTHNLHMFSEYVKSRLAGQKYVKEIWDKEGDIVEDIPVYRTSGTNAWVNITFGCNNYCSYCIVPYVRGRERSRDFDTIVNEVIGLLKEGYKEITLLGQNVNSYGNDLGKTNEFSRLLNTLGALPYKYRLRFMTSHPKDLTKDVVDAIAKYPNICKYIHLPVQAGSNRILKEMNRKYTREEYLDKIKMIKDNIPGVGITTDIMVGFPGEAEEDFSDTLDLVNKCDYSAAFTFIYSRRKGTKADLMDNQIPYEIKQRRIGELIKAQNAITKKLSQDYIGKVFEVLVEDINPKIKDMYMGRTDNGRLVNFPCDHNIYGQFVNVKITKAKSATLWGEVVE